MQLVDDAIKRAIGKSKVILELCQQKALPSFVVLHILFGDAGFLFWQTSMYFNSRVLPLEMIYSLGRTNYGLLPNHGNQDRGNYS